MWFGGLIHRSTCIFDIYIFLKFNLGLLMATTKFSGHVHFMYWALGFCIEYESSQHKLRTREKQSFFYVVFFFPAPPSGDNWPYGVVPEGQWLKSNL